MTKEQDAILTDLLINLDSKVASAVRDTLALCCTVGIPRDDALVGIHAALLTFICFQVAHHSTISAIDFGITMSQTLEGSRLYIQQQKSADQQKESQQ